MTDPKTTETEKVTETVADKPYEWEAPKTGWGGVEHEVIHRAKDYSSFTIDWQGEVKPGYRFFPNLGWVKNE